MKHSVGVGIYCYKDRLQKKAKKEKPGQEIEDAALLLFDQARILDGEPVSDVKAFAQRLSKVMELGLV